MKWTARKQGGGASAQRLCCVATSPCLGCLDVTPLWARLEFPDCHYMTVAFPSGGVGGFNSVGFSGMAGSHGGANR